MPLLPNAKKALRVSKRKTDVNARVKSIIKTMVDKVKKSPSAQNLSNAYSAVDTAVKQNLLHKNKASRLKSQLSKLAKPENKVNGEARESGLGQKEVKATSTKPKAVAKKASVKKTATKTKAAPKKVAAKKTAKK